MKKPGLLKLFAGLNYTGATLTFLAALGGIASTTRLSAACPYLLPLALILFVAGESLIVIARLSLTRTRLKPLDVAALIGLNALLSFWDLIAIVIGLPFIAVTIALGPFMVIVCVLASVALGFYFVEEVIGSDLSGYISVLESPLQAFVALLVLIASVLVLRWHFGTHESEDWLMDKAGNLILDLRQQLQGMVDNIIQRGDGGSEGDRHLYDTSRKA